MLTPEQTRLRIAENEIRTLRAENARLTEKLKSACEGAAQMIDAISPHLDFGRRRAWRKMASELRAMNKEN